MSAPLFVLDTATAFIEGNLLSLAWPGDQRPVGLYAARVIGMDKHNLFARSSLESRPLDNGIEYVLRGEGLYEVGFRPDAYGDRVGTYLEYWGGQLVLTDAERFLELAHLEWGRLLREARQKQTAGAA